MHNDIFSSFNRRINGISAKLLLPVLLSGTIMFILFWFTMHQNRRTDLELASVKAGASLASQLLATRSFYTEEVVKRARKLGVRVNYDFDHRFDTLPLPATMIGYLGKQIRQEYPGSVIRLYSRYPFPHRKESEHYDQFELDAIDHLEHTPETPYYRLEPVEGRLSIRYAVADLMLPGCVGCHNNHPETPKNDWNIGDLRGVVEVVIPVDDINHNMEKLSSIILIAGMATVVAIMGFMFVVMRKSLLEPLQHCAMVIEEIAQGKVEQRIQLIRPPPTEIGIISSSINHMATNIQQLLESLKKDISTREQLEKEAQKWALFSTMNPNPVFSIDKQQRVLSANPAAQRDFNLLSGQSLQETLTPLTAEIDPTTHFNSTAVIETIVSMDKRSFIFTIQSIPEHQLVHIYGLDITRTLQAEAHIRLMAMVFENSSEAVVITNPQADIIEVNPAYTVITGFERHEIIGANPRIGKSGHHDALFYKKMWDTLLKTGHWHGEIWDRRKNGEVYPKWLTINTVLDKEGCTTHYVGIFSDMSKKKATEEQLKQLAYYDALTNLPNRTLFQDRLQQYIGAAQRKNHSLAVMMIDLDRFKLVNDTLGHASGDQLLCEVAQRLSHCIRQTDTVARLGGDEFIVILSEIERDECAASIARKIIDQLQQSIWIANHEVHISASVGITLFPSDGSEPETLLKNADVAMYRSKNMGRGQYTFFKDEMNAWSKHLLRLENGLRKAVEREEFTLVYQPQVSSSDGAIVGVEALIRWNHPEHGRISPGEFIPLAEESGLIIAIGAWVLRTACRQIKTWQDKGLPFFTVGVNVSAKQFQMEDISALVKSTLAETGLEPQWLDLELTEGILMDDAKRAKGILQEIADLGVKISIDDFGTGYSSLSYLARFPFHKLKIDRSFIQNIDEGAANAVIAATVIDLAKSLNLTAVAEGVESMTQHKFLRKRGCHIEQGYLHYKPMSAQELTLLLKKVKSKR